MPEALYAAALRLLTPAYLARVAWRARAEPLYGAHWPQRLGLAYAPAPAAGAIWLHAVSLGETRAAAPLVEALRQQASGLRLILTHTTATGREAGRALLRPGDQQTWLPYDSPGAVRRFLQWAQPSVGVLLETEVWPMLLREAERRGVPMVLANARLSAKSLASGQRAAGLLGAAAARLSLVLAQTDADAQRLRAMGARQVRVTGNLKFDLTPAPELLARGRAWAATSVRPLVLAASTREGEEAELLAAWREGVGPKDADPRAEPIHPARLLIVPRHPQRFDEVAALIRAAGLRLSRRSAWARVPDDAATPVPDAAAQAAEVWLGDSLGEMPAYYAAAQVALLGGSFAPFGGQNLIEAAACACPLIMGPSTYNFAEAAEASLAAGAALRAEGLPDALHKALECLRDAPRREAMARAGPALVAASRGAAHTQATAILGARAIAATSS